MKSYKLNKTLENSTYPIEQELKNLNKSTQNSALKTIISVSTVLFSGISTSFIFENKEYICANYKIVDYLRANNPFKSLVTLFLFFLLATYILCMVINGVIYFGNRHKEQPKNMKKNKYGRERLSEIFHKSIINDIVVGLSFVDKTNEEDEQEIKNMYLYESTYYFLQAYTQIENMEIFDDKNDSYNQKLIDKIGHETLLTTLTVFENGVNSVMDKMIEARMFQKSITREDIKEKLKSNIVEYKELHEILEKLRIHIDLLKQAPKDCVNFNKVK